MAPSAAAPLRSVRRSILGVKDVMGLSSLGGSVSCCRSDFAWCGQAPGEIRFGSGWPLNLAAAVFDRSGGLFAGHGGAYREHIVRVALRRVRLADKHRAHQFVVARAILR